MKLILAILILAMNRTAAAPPQPTVLSCDDQREIDEHEAEVWFQIQVNSQAYGQPPEVRNEINRKQFEILRKKRVTIRRNWALCKFGNADAVGAE